MKPGPFKSTTHGPIALSLRARQLLMDLRNATVAAIACTDWHVEDDALSKARGELALYMSELEARQAQPTLSVVEVSVWQPERDGPVWLQTIFSNGTRNRSRMPHEQALALVREFNAKQRDEPHPHPYG